MTANTHAFQTRAIVLGIAPVAIAGIANVLASFSTIATAKRNNICALSRVRG